MFYFCYHIFVFKSSLLFFEYSCYSLLYVSSIFSSLNSLKILMIRVFSWFFFYLHCLFFFFFLSCLVLLVFGVRSSLQIPDDHWLAVHIKSAATSWAVNLTDRLLGTYWGEEVGGWEGCLPFSTYVNFSFIPLFQDATLSLLFNPVYFQIRGGSSSLNGWCGGGFRKPNCFL